MDTQQLVTSNHSSFQAVPTALDPKTQFMLFAVPSSQPRKKSPSQCPSPYLQTFDIANQRAVSRQALTRNNATDPNVGANGKRILEPNVHHLQISHDGQWLATVDEWLPPKADLTYLDGVSDDVEEERLRRREVYLKIWRRDEKNQQWSLETRIDSNERVLDLVTHPTKHEFATIDEAHVVRVYAPKTRLRDGIVVRGADAVGLVNWSLHQSIDLPKPSKLWFTADTKMDFARTSRLAFSADGSMIAAGTAGSSIHLIDANVAKVTRSLTEIDATILSGLAFVGRYLVIVTDCLNIWDVVGDDLLYCSPATAEVELGSVVLLAVNAIDGTFAVSLPQLENHGDGAQATRIQKATSKILVYNPEQKDPLSIQTISGLALALVARHGEKGYIVLDSVSCIRTIAPSTGGLRLPSPKPAAQTEMQPAENVAEDDQEGAKSEALQLEDIVLEADYDRPVVTQQDLEGIFHNDNAPQAPKDVFSAVLRLFGGVAKAVA